jgi:hypothetical protein
VSFLSIAFLIALPLAAAPVLLHLFDRRRQVVIQWGAMQFLAEAASRRTSARRLKQWLLLLLRTLAVAALVLALTRPMLPGSWLGGADRAETIFIVDNSMSMLRKGGDSSLWEQAINRAIEEANKLPPGDFVRVLLASPYPVWATTGSVRVDAGSPNALEEQLRSLRPTDGRSDLLAALFTATQAEVQPTQKERRIVLLTDGQRTDWSLDDGGWRRFREVLRSAPAPTYVEIVELDRAKDAGNVALGNLQTSRTVVGVNQPFRLTAHVHNYGPISAASCTAAWSVGQAKLHESQVPGLPAGAEHDMVWRHSFSEPGVYAISCRLNADDQLVPDNQATVVVEVIEQAPVLVVENAAHLAEIQQDSFFLQAALGWIDGEPLDEKAIYAPTLIEPEELAQTDLKPYRAVVIPNYIDLTKDAVDQLQKFVFDGGGLWLALGPRTDVEAFNQFLFGDGAGLAPLAIDGLVDEEVAAGSNGDAPKTAIDPFLPEHPATAELANHDQLDLGDVAVARRFRFLPAGDGEEASVLLRLNNGEPLTVEKYLGRGRVIVQAVPLRLGWSELVRSQAFVVMVHDWLDYLAQPRATRHNLKPGEPIAIHMTNPQSPQATLRTPQGDEIELTADAVGDGLVFRTSRTILPGDYWLDLGLSGNSIPFHVQRDPEESQLAPLTAADQELLAQATGPGGDLAAESQVGATRSDPLWPLLLMTLIGLISAELLLSGVIARERFGADPISETTEPWMASSSGAASATDGQRVAAALPAASIARERESLTT